MKKHYIIVNGTKYQLPVPPSSYEIETSNNVSTVNLIGFGEIINGSNPNLKTWSIEKYFPYTNYLPTYISDDEILTPWEYVDLFEPLKDNATPIEYMITDTSIYLPCIITDFKYGEDDGTGDVNYTLTFKENKSIELVSKDGVVGTKGFVSNQYEGRQWWTVKAGDTALTIAKKAYGDSSKYIDLLKKNKLKNPSQLKIGMMLAL